MTILRNLLTALLQSTWNRIRRESGLAGTLTTAVVLALVMLVLAGPAFMAFKAGLSLGREMRQSAFPQPLFYWNALQALFAALFAVLGGLRYHPTFTAGHIRSYPIPSIQLMAAEFAASIFEVFPLLAVAGILFSNLGLAVALHEACVPVLLLALQGTFLMLSLLLITGNIKRFLYRHPVPAFVIGAATLIVLLWMGTEGIRSFAREAIPFLPGSQGYIGLMELWHGGQAFQGLARILLAMCAMIALLVFGAWFHRSELSGETGYSRLRNRHWAFRFSRAPAGIGRLYQKQMLNSKSGQVQLILPLLITGCFAVLFWAVQTSLQKDDGLRDFIERYVPQFLEYPFFALSLFLVVPLNSELWMNQFGWDRAGVRTLLLLPISSRDLLVGKMLGLMQFLLLQSVIALVPVILVYAPTFAEVLSGLGAAGTAYVIAVAVGHVFSFRFPQAVSKDAAAHLPFYLSWFPAVLMIVVGIGLIKLSELAAMLSAAWGRPIILMSILGVSILAYFAALPILAGHVDRRRERLLQM